VVTPPPGKVGEFHIGQLKVREMRKSHCGLLVICYTAVAIIIINIT